MQNFWATVINNNASYTWNLLLKARQRSEGLIDRKIINGDNTDIWVDLWINGTSLLEKHGWNFMNVSGGLNRKVSTLLAGNVWKDNLDYVPTHIQKTMHDIKVHYQEQRDFWFWILAVVVNSISNRHGMKLETSIQFKIGLTLYGTKIMLLKCRFALCWQI